MLSVNGEHSRTIDFKPIEEYIWFPKEVIKLQNTSGARDHLKNHQKYPATKAELVAECNNLSDFSEEDKKEFAAKLPGGTYNSADDVIKAVGL